MIYLLLHNSFYRQEVIRILYKNDYVILMDNSVLLYLFMYLETDWVNMLFAQLFQVGQNVASPSWGELLEAPIIRASGKSSGKNSK